MAPHKLGTPLEAKIQDAKDLLDYVGAKYTRKKLFDYFGVNERTGYRILKGNPRPCEETRGRKRLFSKQQVDQMEQFLNQEGETPTLPWQNLPDAAGVELSDPTHPPSKETVRGAMNARGWRKCGVCLHYWVSYDTANQREWSAREWLHHLGLEPESYRHIRYSNEVHFKFGPEGKVVVTRRPAERYCTDCNQNRKTPNDSADRQICLHAWACVGHNFKSNLIFYQVDNYSNGGIDLQIYRDQILQPHVNKWIGRGDSFVLKEDNNLVRQWKVEEVMFDPFYNCPGAPDLAPIEDCWKAPKPTHKKHPAWDEAALRAAAIEGWDAVEQSTINEWCDSVPFKLLDVVDGKGENTGH